LGVALGSAAAKLTRIEKEFVEQAVREELAELGLDPARLEKNVQLAIGINIATKAHRNEPRSGRRL
jgi:hypothetical protein